MPDIPNIPRAPLNAATSDVLYNELVDAVTELREWVSSTSIINGIPPLTGRPRIPEIFIGLTTSTPCSSSQTAYTDARYYVTRAMPKNGLTYGDGGTCTDLLLAQTDDFNGKLPVPGCVTATNVSELPAQLDAKGTGNGGGTHLLPNFMPVIVFAFPSRQNPMKKVYLFSLIPPTRLFAVKCTKDGGIAGSMTAATTCSWTYTITQLDGSAITGGTALTPKRTRYANCTYDLPAANSYGIAFYDSSGTIQLADVFAEKPTGSVVTNIVDYQVVDGSFKIQVKTQDQLVLDSKTVSGWVDKYTGATCP